ncbi:MAG: type II toxin-antitoxin system RelE/ParE family toxin [Pseudomonadota bacterium]
MPELIISPEANQDLLDIWLYIAEDSTINADHFLDKLHIKAINLSKFTEMGIGRPELAKDLKSFPVDRYMLYYKVVTTGIELVRVLHGSRDSQPLF